MYMYMEVRRPALGLDVIMVGTHSTGNAREPSVLYDLVGVPDAIPCMASRRRVQEERWLSRRSGWDRRSLEAKCALTGDGRGFVVGRVLSTQRFVCSLRGWND